MARPAESSEFAYGLRVVQVITRRRLRQFWFRLRALAVAIAHSPTVSAAGHGLLQLLGRVPGLGRLAARPDGTAARSIDRPSQDAIDAFKASRAQTPPPQTYTLGEDPRRGRGRVQGKSRELKRQVVEGLTADRTAVRRKKSAR